MKHTIKHVFQLVTHSNSKQYLVIGLKDSFIILYVSDYLLTKCKLPSFSFLLYLKFSRELVSLMEDPTVLEIAEKYGKTPAQVAVRFQLQRGIGVLVKSVKIERQQENFQVNRNSCI